VSGGSQSRATCPGSVENLPAEADLPEISIDEDDLLDGSDHRSATSRLSCQIPFSARMAGMSVVIAPED
jgi:2Fe-2S ferredoxin